MTAIYLTARVERITNFRLQRELDGPSLPVWEVELSFAAPLFAERSLGPGKMKYLTFCGEDVRGLAPGMEIPVTLSLAPQSSTSPVGVSCIGEAGL